jgi:hypothetical protein
MGLGDRIDVFFHAFSDVYSRLGFLRTVHEGPMGLLSDVVSGFVSGVLATAVVAVAAAIWRWRLLRKYALTKAAIQVIESLWDENLLRRSGQIAAELGLGEDVVLAALEELRMKKLVRERNRPNGNFWKITLKGKEYLSQRSWFA